VDSTYGNNICQSKNPDTFTMVYNNVQGFPTDVDKHEKVLLTHHWIHDDQRDLFAGVEAQINWPAMPFEGKHSHWFHHDMAMKAISTHNVHKNIGRRQYGGTFMLAYGDFAAHILKSGVDPSGLGRWCWFRVASKQGQVTRIVMCYQPILQPAECLQSTYQQQLRYFQSQEQLICPREAFLVDLREALLQWTQANESLIVCGDFNEETCLAPVASLLPMRDWKKLSWLDMVAQP
jgi:hypothetical protein